MAEMPTLLYRDASTGRALSGVASLPGATLRLVDDEGHAIEASEAQTRGDFARYRLFGIDLPVGVALVRHEDDGAETTFLLDEYREGEPAGDETRAPWRATFVSSAGERLALAEDELREGLQEHPPVFRFG